MMDSELYHAGVKGMKWGKRKARPPATRVTKSSPKKSVKTGAKKANTVLKKTGHKTVKAAGKSVKLGASVMQSLYNISDTGVQNRQMTTYLNTASQMSPEYRRRFMYD